MRLDAEAGSYAYVCVGDGGPVLVALNESDAACSLTTALNHFTPSTRDRLCTAAVRVSSDQVALDLPAFGGVWSA